MAGIPGKGGVKGRSGPPGNMNAFKHGLAAIQKRREESITTEREENIRQQILEGLIADKGGDEQTSTATRIRAEVIASDAAWLMVFNGAIDHIIQNNPKAIAYEFSDRKMGFTDNPFPPIPDANPRFAVVLDAPAALPSI
jgi:hypothetical protein